MNIKPGFSAVVLLLFPILSFCQISDFVQSETFEWTYWELFDDDQAKTEFLNKSGLTSLQASKVKIIDVDADQIPDVISIPEANKMLLMINNGSSFQTILDLNETLLMIGRPKPWHPIYLLTKNDNCCEQGYYSLNYYRPGFDSSNHLTYIIDKSVIIQKEVELISENLPPFRFELKSDLDLQVSADPASTALGKYTTNASGYAVASKTGIDGRIWWLVLMPIEASSLKAGWMPSNELKRKF